MALQGGITATRAASTRGAWGSNLAGWGACNGANLELDLFAGVKVPVGAGQLHTGLVWHMYPRFADNTDYGELYAKLSGNAGLGPNSTSLAPTGSYFDWMLGADVTPVKGLALSVA